MVARPAVALLALAACAAANPGTDSGGETLADCAGELLWGLTIVDATTREESAAVCLEGDRIAWVSPVDPTDDPPPSATDFRGEFLVPGLVDSHVHLAHSGATQSVGDALEINLRANLWHGVTQVFDVGGPLALLDLRERLAAQVGAAPVPRIVATGPFLTAPGSHPCETLPDPDLCVFVADESSGATEAAALRDAGADAIKVAVADAAFTPWGATPRLDLSALDGIVSEGLPVVAHVDTDEDALDAVAHGVSLLAHPPFAAAIGPDGITAGQAALAVHSTVSAFGQVGDLVDGSFDPNDEELIVADAVRMNWMNIADYPEVLVAGWLEENAGWTDNARANLAELIASGARVVPGSDAGYYFVPHGWALHRELRELVAAGMTPREALAAATLDAREVLGLDGGRIVAGQPADLLLLPSDPDLDVGALDDADEVIVAGVRWRRGPILEGEIDLGDPAEDGGACLHDDDCISGACDSLAHACGELCPEPWADLNDCGEEAWCMPANGTPADAVGVCRTDNTCDLYAQDCGPDPYTLACLPYDADTSACWFAGPRLEGERCSTSTAESSCEAGLYCSPIDSLCYALCDPSAVDTCTAPDRCVTVKDSAQDPWFGLCL